MRWIYTTATEDSGQPPQHCCTAVYIIDYSRAKQRLSSGLTGFHTALAASLLPNQKSLNMFTPKIITFLCTSVNLIFTVRDQFAHACNDQKVLGFQVYLQTDFG